LIERREDGLDSRSPGHFAVLRRFPHHESNPEFVRDQKRAGKLTTLTASKQHQQKQQQQKQQHLAEQHSHGLLFLHREHHAETKEKTPSRSNQTKRLGWLGHLFCYFFRRSLWIVYICPNSFPPFFPTRSTKQ